MASTSSSPELSPPAASSSYANGPTVQYSNLSEVLEDLSSRFILNLPESELSSLERICFQVEQAHWYYEDFIREQNPSKFPSFTLKNFSEELFIACPLLSHLADDHDRTFAAFMQYKTRVPVCGAIMLNDKLDKCVLVKGWKASSAWSFPKGKINEFEPHDKCAIREVLEETGYDLEGQLDPGNVIQLNIKEQAIHLFVVPGVPENFPFKTRTRKEISDIQWWKLADLPTWKRSKPAPGKFYLISPFIGPLKGFIKDNRPRGNMRNSRRPIPAQARPVAPVSSEDESEASSVHHTQDADSQSSVENGEPQTPSPLYSAAQVNQAPYDDAATNDSSGTVSVGMDGGDAHFRNLFLGLSLSARDIPQGEKGAAAVAPASSNIVVDSIHRELLPVASPLSVAATPANRPASVSARLTPSPNVAPAVSTPPSLIKPTHTIAHHASSRPPASPSSSTVRAGTQSGHGRKGSTTTADISPYLSRAPDITKEMRLINMLESVAQESDRAVSRLNQHPSMPNLQGPAFPPGPSTSVPPQRMRNNPRISPVIYAATPTMQHHVLYSPHQQAQRFGGSTARPTTSQAFHGTPNVGGHMHRPSMHEALLRPMQQLSRPLDVMQQAVPTSMIPLYPNPAASAYPPIGLPSSTLSIPHFGEAPVATVAPTSPHLNLYPSHNAHLLSIFNTPAAPTPSFRA